MGDLRWLGSRVETTMGVRMAGTVIQTIPKSQYTDGSYREPHDHEVPVYVHWDDGTAGWAHKAHLRRV